MRGSVVEEFARVELGVAVRRNGIRKQKEQKKSDEYDDSFLVL